MQSAESRYKSLLSWINPKSSSQANWITQYLYRKDLTYFISGYNPTIDPPEVLRNKLSSHPGNAECRETLALMRRAWYQKEYREKNEKLINFQVPKRIADDLGKIAEDRRTTRTQALRQIVREVATKSKNEKSQTLKANKKLKENLKKLHETKQDSESVRNQIINDLLNMLTKEIILNCRHISSSDSIKENELNETAEDLFNKKLIERLSEAEEQLSTMKILRSGIKRIDELLPEKISALYVHQRQKKQR